MQILDAGSSGPSPFGNQCRTNGVYWTMKRFETINACTSSRERRPSWGTEHRYGICEFEQCVCGAIETAKIDFHKMFMVSECECTACMARDAEHQIRPFHLFGRSIACAPCVGLPIYLRNIVGFVHVQIEPLWSASMMWQCGMSAGSRCLVGIRQRNRIQCYYNFYLSIPLKRMICQSLYTWVILIIAERTFHLRIYGKLSFEMARFFRCWCLLVVPFTYFVIANTSCADCFHKTPTRIISNSSGQKYRWMRERIQNLYAILANSGSIGTTPPAAHIRIDRVEIVDIYPEIFAFWLSKLAGSEWSV